MDTMNAERRFSEIQRPVRGPPVEPFLWLNNLRHNQKLPLDLAASVLLVLRKHGTNPMINSRPSIARL